MIALFTDFGCRGPYLGQMRAALLAHAGNLPVVNLQADAPAFDPRASSHLLAAQVACFALGTVFLCVVDPGVGTERAGVILEADGRVFVGPDNGLLDVVAARAQQAAWWTITWRPAYFSASFHGRDLFAPVAGALARGEAPATLAEPLTRARGSDDDLAEVIYIDGYGNAMTGWRADTLAAATRLQCGAHTLRYRRTFAEAAPGEPFWYCNSLGLVEIAVNRDSAAERLGLTIGTPLAVVV